MDQNEKIMWVQTLWDPLNEKNNSLMESKEPGIRVVAYCRVSDNKNNSGSLENQVSYYTNLIKSRPNWKFIGIYFDNGISGATYSKRPGFKRLLRHSEEGRIDLILTKNISRFSRNTKELIDVVDWLKEKKVAIFFEKENIDTSQNYNRFLLEVYAAIAQEEIENISQLVRWANEKKFMKGIPTFGDTYGYDMNKNKGNPIVKINEAEAHVVRWIFNQFLSGNTYTEIARQLVKQGVKTKHWDKKGTSKKFWAIESVRRIIKDITYTGNKTARTRTRDILSNDNTLGKRDEFLIENSHPAIISNEIYDKAQVKANDRRRKKFPEHIHSSLRPLSKRITCGYCGQKFNIKHPNIWKCRTTSIGKEFCKSKELNEKEIIKMILKAFIRKYDFEDKEIYKKLLKKIQKVNQNDNFEFYRLKYLSEIELASHYAVDDDLDGQRKVDELRETYQDFENKIVKIEDDRIYRDAAILWAMNINSIEEFCEGLTIEYLRAWIMELKVYSIDVYIVYWIDGDETIVGESEIRRAEQEKVENEIEINEQTLIFTDFINQPETALYKDEKILDKGVKLSEKIIKPDDDIKICDNKVKSTEKEGESLQSNSNIEVIKMKMGETIPNILNLNNSIKSLQQIKNLKIKHEELNLHQNLSKDADKKTIRVAGYGRISTNHEEQLVSLKIQIAYYTFLILKKKEWELSGIYADEGISGTSTKNRVEFLRLMDDCRAGKVDLIITKSISRFSRNCLETLEFTRMLKNLPNPVYCYFEKENINTSDQKSEMMISLYASIAQEESAGISSSISWGLKSNAQRGIITQRQKIYGYDIGRDGNWVINPNEVQIIKRICEEFLGGKSFPKIIEGLYKDGIKSPRGAETWNHQQMISMLSNEKYKGDFLYQKSYHIDVVNKKRRTNTGQLSQYYIEKHHIAIIEPNDWDQIQEKLQKRTRKRKEYRTDIVGREVFYKMFYCSSCQGLIIRYKDQIREKQKSGESFWRCFNSIVKEKGIYCSSSSIQEKYIEYNFMSTLLNIKNSDKFRKDAEQLISQIALNENERNMENQYRRDIEDLNQQLYEAVDKELNKHGQDARKIDLLTGEIVRLQGKLKKLTIRTEKATKYREEVIRLIEEIEKIDDFNSNKEMYKFRDDIFKRFIERGEIDKHGVIKYNFKFGMEHHVDMIYQDYLDMQSSIEKAEKIQKLINSKEIQQLLKFCEEPKRFGEMKTSMNIESKTSFCNRILHPLLDAGHLKRTVPEDTASRKQRYYSVK